MRQAYADLLGASEKDRRGIYQEAVQEWPTSAYLIEKDLMVCAVMDVLFNDVPDAADNLVFKGGTSLSKAHKLISRFSEDIDLVVRREELGFEGDDDPLDPNAPMGSSKREKLVKRLKKDCAAYMEANLLPPLNDALSRFGCSVEIDENEPQTIFVHYPSALPDGSDYNLPSIKIEGGARSATLPAHEHEIRPYVADILDNEELRTPGITTIDAERTFLDKLIILHGRHCHFRDRGEVYRNANRESRHYYDLAMMEGGVGDTAIADADLLADVIEHARMSFASKWMKLDEAAEGNLLIKPNEAVESAMRQDYAKMSGMILGDVPSFDRIMEAIGRIDVAYQRIRQR